MTKLDWQLFRAGPANTSSVCCSFHEDFEGVNLTMKTCEQKNTGVMGAKWEEEGTHKKNCLENTETKAALYLSFAS
ncbi:hypothetical protein POVCU2_0064640 [Plasmodium ovale curtisi]|uniref:Uncharacterized protein n=1 Tax=Plasmodium ovale curtisi TaxID=864141 RepID=A0A1A8W219_PLAOA|nr:hypothetical protein POVCU1_013100 [Plasmodium ovale curtisi]SBS90959.1 hypothetical protein POVCU2_0064640 [Plasmodium ovale curtisi]